MSKVVLRHKDSPDPYVGDFPGGVVPSWFKDSGWEIDSKTSVEDAESEAADNAQKRAEKAANRKPSVGRAKFADADVNETASSGQSSAAPEPTKEN